MHESIHGTYVHNGFLLLALVLFLLAGLGVAHPRLSWIPLGYASVVAAYLFPFFI